MEENKDWREELQDIINREMFKEDLMIQIKSLVEQELDKAERRGAISLYKELDDLDIMLAMLHSVEDTNDEEVHKIVGNIRNELKKTLDKLKLLEEENGKQNAR